MSRIDSLFSRIVERKMELHHQPVVDRLNNRHKEDVPPLFWVAVLVICVLLTSNALAADAKLMIDIIECESSGRHNVIGDDGVSYGIAQFRRETFHEFAKKADMKGVRYRNPVHQLRVMNWALDNGYGNRWTCFRKLAAMDSVRAAK